MRKTDSYPHQLERQDMGLQFDVFNLERIVPVRFDNIDAWGMSRENIDKKISFSREIWLRNINGDKVKSVNENVLFFLGFMGIL